MKPQPIRFTTEEGGKWIEWGDMDNRRRYNGPNGIRFHSVTFDDGSVLDMLNGWRDK